MIEMDESIEREVYKAAKQHYTSADAVIEAIRSNNTEHFLHLPVDQTLELYCQIRRLFNRIRED